MTKTPFRNFVLLLTVSVASCLGLFSQDMRPLAASLAPRITASGRKTVAVVDFTDLEGNPTKLGRFLAEEFSIALLQDAKGFEVVDRTHINTLLQEHKLASSGLIDPATARKLGQIAGVDALVTGTITPFEEHIRVSVKVLDTETAKMIAADTADIPKTKTLADIQNAEVTGGIQQPKSPTRSGPNAEAASSDNTVSALQDGCLFLLKTCVRSGSRVTCTGQIVNKTNKPLRFWFQFLEGYLVDDLGNQYHLRDGNLGAGENGQVLQPDLAINFSYAAEEVDPKAQRVALLLRYSIGGYFEGTTVTLRDVPLH